MKVNIIYFKKNLKIIKILFLNFQMDIPKAIAAVVPVMAAAPAFASVDVSN